MSKWETYRKKPVAIQAARLTPESFDSLVDETANALGDGTARDECCIEIETLEGCMMAREGDWIIRGIKGELYPCRNDIFCATYEDATLKKELKAQQEELHDVDRLGIIIGELQRINERLDRWEKWDIKRRTKEASDE